TRKKIIFHTKAQRHEEKPIENIQVSLCVLRDLCVRTTFYEGVIFGQGEPVNEKRDGQAKS
ncbi:MAG: hypothetical protein KKE00_12540, partial [Proteobacteria bacterium]|nr:hypothetical protein [Pseudomonadota bacterium]